MQIVQTRAFVPTLQALRVLQGLDSLYPGFNDWYVNKVVPGVVLGNDQLLIAQDAGRIVGLALGKRSADETKLRCVRVLPAYEGQGLGIKLIDRMLDVLECDKPHCTVAEEMLHSYSRAFVTRYGFELNAVDKGRYRPGKLEYSFN